MTDIAEFLKAVVTTPQGYFCLALSTINGEQWREEWYQWPDDIDKIVDRALIASTDFNVNFSSYLFSAKSRVKGNCLPSRTIQADLDAADINELPIDATILVQSSPNRHHGYWILDETPDTDVHEHLSRKLAYAIEGCDRAGWPLGHTLRIPNTLNHKYLDGPHAVRVTVVSKRSYSVSQFELLPDVPSAKADVANEDFINKPPTLSIGPQELFAQHKEALGPKVAQQYNARSKDRSAALWALECTGFRAGLSREEVYWLAKHSANNKFTELKANGDRELAKDVLRAEALVQNNASDPRSIIHKARKLTGQAFERKQHISQLVLAHMRETGEFIRTNDDNVWYIRRDLGRPILLSHRSDYLNMILDLQYGLNATEEDQRYCVQHLVSFGHNLPSTGTNARLSYYDKAAGVLMLHGGKKTVYRIGSTSIESVADGAYRTVFPWTIGSEPFTLSTVAVDWHTTLFGDCLDNVIGIEKAHAMAMLRVWFLFLLFRSIAVSRPILALFGQPGAGKSTLFRRIYALLYGKQRALGAVTKPDDFDYAVASEPLTVLDNVDSWADWLPDRLALSASTSDLTKRQLYTDVDVVVLRRQALIGITAHNPRFGREDVADRLLLLTFERLPYFKPEGEIIDRILRQRNQLWTSIVNDVQAVLRQPQPVAVPQFRVEDFARIGCWIASALGIDTEFRAALKTVQLTQKQFSIDEEHILVTALSSLVAKASAPRWYSAGQLWTDLEMYSTDPTAFRRSYGNAVRLGKKLWAMQDALKAVFDIEWKYDTQRNTRVWRIGNARVQDESLRSGIGAHSVQRHDEITGQNQPIN